MDDIHYVYDNFESLIFLAAAGCACKVQSQGVTAIAETLTVIIDPT